MMGSILPNAKFYFVIARTRKYFSYSVQLNGQRNVEELSSGTRITDPNYDLSMYSQYTTQLQSPNIGGSRRRGVTGC